MVTRSATSTCSPAPLERCDSTRRPCATSPGQAVRLTLHGLGFRPDSVASSGEGVVLTNPTYVAPDEFRVDVTADTDADLGSRNISIQNPGPTSNALFSTYDECECLTIT